MAKVIIVPRLFCTRHATTTITVYGPALHLTTQAPRPLHATRTPDAERVQVAAAYERGSLLVARRAPRKSSPPPSNGSGLARLSRRRHHRGQRSRRARGIIFRPHADEDPLARVGPLHHTSVGKEGPGRREGRRVLVRQDQKGSVSAVARQCSADCQASREDGRADALCTSGGVPELVAPEARGGKRREISPPSRVTKGVGGVCESERTTCGPSTALQGEGGNGERFPSGLNCCSLYNVLDGRAVFAWYIGGNARIRCGRRT